jgi:hypothetical protein
LDIHELALIEAKENNELIKITKNKIKEKDNDDEFERLSENKLSTI